MGRKSQKKSQHPAVEAGLAEETLEQLLEACSFGGEEKSIAADTKAVYALKQRLDRNTASRNKSFVCLQPPYTSNGSTESVMASFLYF